MAENISTPKDQVKSDNLLSKLKKNKKLAKLNPVTWSKRVRIGAVVALFAVTGGIILLLQTQAATLLSENFSSSSSASNLSAEKGGTWAVSRGTYNLTRASTASDLTNSNLSIHKTTVPDTNYTYKVDGRATSTSSRWDDFSVAFNYIDANNYYYASFNESSNSTTNGVFKVTNGTGTKVKDFSSTTAGGSFYTIKIEKNQKTVNVYRGQTLMATVSDEAFKGGKVGVGSYNNDATFDNLSVVTPEPVTTPPPAPTPTPTPTPTPAPNPTPPPVTSYTCTKTLEAGGNLKTFVGSLTSGQTGCLRAGTYGGSDVYISKPDVTLASYPGEKATIATFMEVTPEAARSKLMRVKIDGTNVSSNTTALKIQANDFILSDNEITKGGKGICVLIGSYNASERVIVERNRIYNCGPSTSKFDHQLYLGKAKGTIIRHNLLTNNPGGWGVHFYPAAQNNVVEYNIIDGNHGGVIFAGDGSGTPSSGNIVRYNAITYSSKRWNLEGSWSGGPAGTGNVSSQNCLFTTGSSAPSGVNAPSGGFTSSNEIVLSGSPYVNRAAGDYKFSSAGAACANVVGDVVSKITF
jgi:hypothetical protein